MISSRLTSTTAANDGESGQALIEFILFLPFLIALLSLMVTLSSSINGAINQQKATRAYFYYTIKGNSTFPLARYVYNWKDLGAVNAGYFAMGWMDYDEGTAPVSSCYQVNSLLAAGNDDECADHMPNDTSRQIKVFTAYGMCGNLYTIGDSGHAFHNTQRGGSQGACVISQ